MLSFYWTVFLWRGKNNKRFASSEITHLCYRSICCQKSCTLLGARNTVDNPEQDFFAHCINSIIETCTPGQIKIAHICSKFLLLHWKGTKSLPPYLRCYIDSWTRKFGTMTQQWKMIEIFASLPDISFYIRCSGHEPQTPLFVWV